MKQSNNSDFSINAVGQIYIEIQDISRAVNFYRDVLGMTLQFEIPQQNMAFFDCGGIRLYLGKAAEKPEKDYSPLIYYRVDSIQDAYETLVSRSVNFDKLPQVIHETPEFQMWLASFSDTEGNILHIMSEESRS